MKTFFGKYRGKVEDNVDPKQMGRVRVSVPAVLGDSTDNWAMPCAPYAGSGIGFFAIPPKGANIWVEFEGGDPDRPVWVGCFWDEKDTPADSGRPGMKVLKTDKAKIVINDEPGASSITIETGGAKVVIDSSSGIEITDGKGGSIKISQSQVSVNNGALEVM
jgi:uncharacterized protein involved in type VI secretion and phage assembly